MNHLSQKLTHLEVGRAGWKDCSRQKLSLLMMIWMRRMHPNRGGKVTRLEPMLKDSNFDELDAEIENVEEETVYAATTRVNTTGGEVTTANVRETINTAKLRPPITTTVFDDKDVTMAMAKTLMIKMKEEKAKEKGLAIK
ncbi:hypothetical protein Tco_0334615, partial [Tanacetum coccineum]